MKIRYIEKIAYTFSIDEDKNRVYLLFNRHLWNDEDMEEYFNDWKQILKRVGKNFTLLSDVRLFSKQLPKLDKSHEEIQKYVSENGLLKMARVISNDDIVNFQLGRITERSGLPSNTFQSPNEAEKYLDQLSSAFKATSTKFHQPK